MRTFAQELILVTALALGVSAIAAPNPPSLDPEELSALAAEKLAKQKPEDRIESPESRQKVLAAQRELTIELEKRGYDKETALSMASTGLGKLSTVRDPCRLPPSSPAYSVPGKEALLTSLGIEKTALTCAPGAETLAMLLANQEIIRKEEVQKPKDKPKNPEPPTEKDDSKPKGSAPVGDGAKPDLGKKAASDGPTNSASTPKSDAPLGGMALSGGGATSPRLSAPQLGPLMGSSNRGGNLMGGFAGHKGGRAASPRISTPSTPAQNQNLEIVRQALQQKILTREITPEFADNLLSKLSPALQKEPDLASALQLTEWDSPAPPASAKPRASKVSEPTKPTADKAVTQKSESSNGPSSKPASIEAPKEPERVWVLNGAANSIGLSDIKKGTLGATLASSIANAIAKKGAPLPSEDAVGKRAEGNGDGDYSVSGSSSPSSTTVENTPSADPTTSEPDDKKPIVQSLLGTNSFKRIVERISLALRGNARKPASAEVAAFEHFAQTESIALASLGRDTDVPIQTRLSAWTPVFFFFTPFTLTLVGFALWRWQKRRRG
jgi:hypothetical protein